MPPLPPSPPSSPLFEALFAAAAVLYALYVLTELVRPSLRAWPLALGAAVHLAGLVTRGLAIDFFPLTNKFESFYAFSLSISLVGLFTLRSPSRVHRLGLFVVGAIFYAVATRFDRGVFYPPPLMHTIWYPLHVPASFLSYALWVSAAAGGVATWLGGGDERTHRAALDHAFYGWCVFSLSMLFGGAWGYVAWGAYFLWDPKVVWSVVLWLYYSGFVHLRYWPALNRPGPKAALAVLGVVFVMVAYVGTSFFFHHGSHAFG